MNIYCVIFMCTFGANNTETSVNNSLIEYNKTESNHGSDIASMILPARGQPVPQFRDIVMELPVNNNSRLSKTTATGDSDSRGASTPEGLDELPSPTLSDILLPPAPLRRRGRAIHQK